MIDKELNNKKNDLISLFKSRLKDPYQGFYHFTDFKNLYNIYKFQSIFCRSYIEDNNIKFHEHANTDVISNTNYEIYDYVRLHFKSRTPDFYTAKLIDPCYLVIDYNILFNDNYQINMTSRGAAYKYENRNIPLISPKYVQCIIDNYDFNHIFDSYYLPDYKDVQLAEILIKNKIDIKDISCIIFRNFEQKQRFIKEFPNWNINTYYDNNLFEPNIKGA